MFSDSEDRRAAQRAGGHATKKNLIQTTDTLKLREGWKYRQLEVYLNGRQFEFEYKIDKFIYDLALLDSLIVVEFDGPYHAGDAQQRIDAIKEDIARKAGFTLVRRSVPPASIISPETIFGL